MDAKAELPEDLFEDGHHSHVRILPTELIHERQYVVRQLMGTSGTALLRYQTGETMGLESFLGRIERGPREPIRGGGLIDRPGVLLDTPNHLVLHLNEILGIEEGVVEEELVLNHFRFSVEHALPSQGCRLAAGLP
jgi:hypothetical protein